MLSSIPHYYTCMIKKKSVIVEFARQTNTDTKGLHWWLQCSTYQKIKNTDISSRTKKFKKHWHFKSSMLSSIPHHYTFMVKRKVSIVEFASTNQHWHQKFQCWLHCSTKKQTNTDINFLVFNVGFNTMYMIINGV